MTAVETGKAEYTEKLRKHLEEAQHEFQQMELEQMKKGEVEARAILAKAQKRFQERRGEFEAKLKKARKASDSAWDELRQGLDDAWDELRGSITRARAEFAGEVMESDEEDTD